MSNQFAQITFRLPQELKLRLEETACAEGMSLNAYLLYIFVPEEEEEFFVPEEEEANADTAGIGGPDAHTAGMRADADTGGMSRQSPRIPLRLEQASKRYLEEAARAEHLNLNTYLIVRARHALAERDDAIRAGQEREEWNAKVAAIQASIATRLGELPSRRRRRPRTPSELDEEARNIMSGDVDPPTLEIKELVAEYDKLLGDPEPSESYYMKHNWRWPDRDDDDDDDDWEEDNDDDAPPDRPGNTDSSSEYDENPDEGESDDILDDDQDDSLDDDAD